MLSKKGEQVSWQIGKRQLVKGNKWYVWKRINGAYQAVRTSKEGMVSGTANYMGWETAELWIGYLETANLV
jgi:hypothetical protein